MNMLPRFNEWKEVIPNYHEQKSKKVHAYSSVVQSVVDELGVVDVIDFGCGDGSLCTLFSKNRYLGLDVNEKILQKAQKTFEGYAFKKPSRQIFSADLCVASNVFNEINDHTIDAILARMRCKWLLLAEPLHHESKGIIQPFHSRDKDSYIKLMRAHDLLLIKQMNKKVSIDNDKDVTFLLFKKATKNPVL